MPPNMVNIGEVVVNAIIFNPKQSEVFRTMDLEGILHAVPRLFDLLEQRGIDYMVVGGIAMLVYVEGRNTQDIDLIMAAGALDRLPEFHVEERNPEFARARFGDLRVDLLLTTNPLFEKVRSKYTVTQPFAERAVPCATPEGLLLLKLFALPALYRQQQFDRVELYEHDVAMLLRQFHPNLSPLWDELVPHVLASDLEELHRIVAEIQDRIAKSGERFGNCVSCATLRGSPHDRCML